MNSHISAYMIDFFLPMRSLYIFSLEFCFSCTLTAVPLSSRELSSLKWPLEKVKKQEAAATHSTHYHHNDFSSTGSRGRGNQSCSLWIHAPDGASTDSTCTWGSECRKPGAWHQHAFKLCFKQPSTSERRVLPCHLPDLTQVHVISRTEFVFRWKAPVSF